MDYIKFGGGPTVSRIIKGCWQMSAGHGAGATGEAAVEELLAFYDAGITTFDGGDIYTGVEELFGHFRKECLQQRGEEAQKHLRFHTKFVPDLEALPTMNRQYVERVIDRSLERIGVDCLDLVQFHWWDFDIPGHVETAHHLAALQQAGKIKNIGVTNYDTVHLDQTVRSGVTVVSNQVQYSAIDRRPQKTMLDFCAANHIYLLYYGSLAGGFLSEHYLGKANPGEPFVNRSLIKYKLVIDDNGGWSRFQFLLQTLKQIAGKHGVTIPSVAMALLLNDRPSAAVIAGGSARHLPDMMAARRIRLDTTDMICIHEAAPEELPGDVYELERQKGGKHAAIMRYDLNQI